MASWHEPDPAADDPLSLESLWRLVERAPSELEADPLLNVTIGGVKIVRVIAEGGMGRVYEGQQSSPRRSVAVKVLRPGPIARSRLRRFVKEAQILAELRHPWICAVHAAGTIQAAGTQLPYLVMEFVRDGMPITEYASRHALSPAETLELFVKVCDAVAHAHARGVTHRDLKPSNILTDGEGCPRVIDFGIARDTPPCADYESACLTGSGEVLGTMQYMSPEQCDGSDTPVDPRADVYSLGLILYELVCGRPAYDVGDVVLLNTSRVIRSRPTVTLASCKAFPWWVRGVINRCLETDRHRRYADAGELANDLRLLLESGGLRRADWLRRFVNPMPWQRKQGLQLIAVTVICAMPVAISIGSCDGRLQRWCESIAVLSKPAIFGPASSRTSGVIAFRYAFTSVLDDEADHHLVSATNMVKWNDPSEDLRVSYWGPEKNEREGVLVYRFTFPGCTSRISMIADTNCWDFDKHHTGFGRGVSAVEASRDGIVWVTLRDDIRERRWGVNCEIRGDLPEDVLGTDELWIRVRLLTEHAEPQAGYTVAQFCRSIPAEGREVFCIEAACEPME